MKLIITDPVSVTAPKNIFKLTIEFMEGDADGTQYRDIKIDSELYSTDEDYCNEVHLLIEALDEVIALDRKGRGGYDDIEDMIRDHYHGCKFLHFLECGNSWNDYASEEEISVTEYSSLMFYIPSEGDSGFYTSFRNYKITYFNPIGIEFQVSIDK
jgi:hypothetical protein